MRQVVLLLVAIAAAIVIPQLLRSDDPVEAPGPKSSSIYAADGAFIGGRTPQIAKQNLIVILLDTVRRDAVGLGDEPGRQMPGLRALAKRGVAFRQAATSAPWTIPTVASVLTGLNPTEHNCRDDGPAPKLLESIVTYAEALRTSFGYQTAAFSDVPWYRGSSWSLLQGFGAGSAGQGLKLRPKNPLESGFWLHGGDEILKPWIAKRDKDRPFFLFLHTYDAHDPYGEANHPPANLRFIRDPVFQREQMDAIGDTRELDAADVLRLNLTSHPGRRVLFRQRGASVGRISARYAWEGYRKNPRPEYAANLAAKYFAGVRWTDEGLAKLIPFLESEGLLEDTLLVIFSDHGEAFGEHGLIGHGRQLEDELVHVPMVMLGPGPFSTPTVVDASVGVIDILPTFFDWIGAPDLARTRGRSLLPVIAGTSPGHAVTTQARVIPEMTGTDAKRILESVRDAGWKYIVEYDLNLGSISERLYDLRTDPKETKNLLEDGRTLPDFELSADFCTKVEGSRDRIWEAADAIRERGMTAYSAGVPTAEQPRPAACGPKAKDR